MGESKDRENKSSNDHQDRLKTKISRTKSANFIKIYAMKTRGRCLNEVGPDDGGEPTSDGEDTSDRQENKDGDVDRTVAW